MEQVARTLITGGSSGIGSEIAMRLSASRKLVLHGRDAARLDATRCRCVDPYAHVLWQQDLADVETIESALVKAGLSSEWEVDHFVHCAGALAIAPMRSMDPLAVRRIMDVNFSAAAELLRLLLKKKLNNGKLKSVVFISSTASQFGAKGFNIYCASKGALDALMRALAVELAPAIRLNSVLPGAVKTAMTGSMFADAETAERVQAGYPLGVGLPGDIADAVEFLISDKARWITGQQLVVDGGRTINITA